MRVCWPGEQDTTDCNIGGTPRTSNRFSSTGLPRLQFRRETLIPKSLPDCKQYIHKVGGERFGRLSLLTIHMVSSPARLTGQQYATDMVDSVCNLIGKSSNQAVILTIICRGIDLAASNDSKSISFRMFYSFPVYGGGNPHWSIWSYRCRTCLSDSTG